MRCYREQQWYFSAVHIMSHRPKITPEIVVFSEGYVTNNQLKYFQCFWPVKCLENDCEI